MYELTPEEKTILDNAKKVLERTNGDVKQLNKRQREVLEMYYGYAFALINSSNELRRLFVNAVKTGQTEEGFANAIRSSKWAGQRDESARKYDTFSQSIGADKADFDRRVQDVANEVIRSAVDQAGVTVSAQDADKVARTILRDNYDSWRDVLPRVVRQRFVKADALEFGGRAYGTLQEINAYARAMGVRLNDAEVGRYVEAIANETDTLENVKSTISKNVAKLYPQFADRINAGATMEDITYQYRKTMASMLEIDEESIDMFGEMGKPGQYDSLLNKALLSTDAKGNPMSMTDFRKMVRQDDRWQYTENARNEYASVARSLMRLFGAGV